jgi:hypothetical protein
VRKPLESIDDLLVLDGIKGPLFVAEAFDQVDRERLISRILAAARSARCVEGTRSSCAAIRSWS